MSTATGKCVNWYGERVNWYGEGVNWYANPQFVLLIIDPKSSPTPTPTRGGRGERGASPGGYAPAPPATKNPIRQSGALCSRARARGSTLQTPERTEDMLTKQERLDRLDAGFESLKAIHEATRREDPALAPARRRARPEG